MAKINEMDRAYYYALVIRLSGEAIVNYANRPADKIEDCIEKAIRDYRNCDEFLNKVVKDTTKITKDVMGSRPYNKSIQEYAEEYFRFSYKYHYTFYGGGNKKNRYQGCKLAVNNERFTGFNGLKVYLYDGNDHINIHERSTDSGIHIKDNIPLICMDTKDAYKGNIGAIIIRNDNYSYRLVNTIDDVIKIIDEILTFDYDLCILPDYRRISNEFMRMLLDKLCDSKDMTISKFTMIVMLLTRYPSNMWFINYADIDEDKKPLNRVTRKLLDLYKVILLKNDVVHNNELELKLMISIHSLLKFEIDNDETIKKLDRLKNVLNMGGITDKKEPEDLDKCISNSLSIEELTDKLSKWSKSALLDRKSYIEDLEIHSYSSESKQYESLCNELSYISNLLDAGDYEEERNKEIEW